MAAANEEPGQLYPDSALAVVGAYFGSGSKAAIF